MRKQPVDLGEKYEVEITGLSHLGEGIGRVNNFAIFIPGAIPGEKVVIKINELKKNFAKGELLEVINVSPHRIETPCFWADVCGGCQLQHVSYAEQLHLKRDMVRDALMRIGGIEVEISPVIGMDYPWRYRNKGNFHATVMDGQIKLGFFEIGSHEFVPAKESLLFSSLVNKLVGYLEELLTFHEIKVYDRKLKRGYLKSILIRESKATGEIMLIIVSNADKWHLNGLVESITGVFPQVISIYHNVNPNAKTTLGNKYNLIWGQEFINDRIGNIVFKITPESFFQVNNQQTSVLYETTLEYANLTGKETVIDAYCGIGSISLFLAQKAKKVFGIEVVKGAINAAKQNAQLNKINNLEFRAAKVEEWLPQWVGEGGKADVIVVDPPRKGCAPETLEAIVKVMPERVVYVSCNPATLARDLQYLVGSGYEVKEVQPVDMFPQTSHVEVIILLQRQNA